jgi:predicted Zn-dependent protease
MALDESQTRRVLDALLEIAAKDAPEAEALATAASVRTAHTRFARSEITTSGDVDETTIAVELAFGKRHARSSTNQTDAASLRQLVARAARMARVAPEDPEYMPVLGPQEYRSAPSSYDEATAGLEAGPRSEAVRAAIAATGKRKLQVAGFFEHSGGGRATASSAGLWAWRRATNASFTISARNESGTASGWAGAVSRRAGEIEAAELARVAAGKVREAKAARLEPGRYSVVLEPAAVGELLAFLLWSLDARSADEGRSFFSTPGGGSRVGEKIFGSGVTLKSDPFAAETAGAAMAADGLPFEPRTWIESGTLKQLVYDRYWASKQGRAPTGWPEQTQLLGGEAASTQELVSGVERGLLITRFWYTRMVDPQSILVTGLTRDGVFLIEDGKVVRPVNNFRFNESPVTMLKNADAMTRATFLNPFAALRVPALRTHEFNLASVSDAV